MPELQDGPQYERDLCSSCRQLRSAEFLDFLEKLKRPAMKMGVAAKGIEHDQI